MQFLEGKFRLESETTIGVEFGSKIVDVGERKLKMQIWDTVRLPWIGGRLGRRCSSRSRDPTTAAPSPPSSCTTPPTAPPSTTSPSGSRRRASTPMTSSPSSSSATRMTSRAGTPTPTQARGLPGRGRRLRRGQSHALHGVLRQGPRAHQRSITAQMQIFFRLAREIMRKIDCGEIDPKNEACGVKLGAYSGGKAAEKGRVCC